MTRKYLDLSPKTFRSLLHSAVRVYPQSLAWVGLTSGQQYTYAQAYDMIQRLKALLLDTLQLKKGDKVALWGENMPNWGITYFAITSAGLVVVPLLPDFSAHEVENILSHSESKVLFVSRRLVSKLKDVKTDIQDIILVEDFSKFTDLESFDISKNIEFLAPLAYDESKEPDISENDLAVIIYTSGTTGKSKGVMHTHRSIISNVLDVQYVQWVEPGEKFLSILPLSHSYENTIGFLAPFVHGATVYYVEKPPTASVLLPALQKVRPTFMLSVPLIIEKIFRKNILPTIQAKKLTASVYKTDLGRKVLHNVAGKKLKKLFGGNIKFFGIGGAKLDPEVERFMREAKFPYAVGYGLTETAPLLAGSNPQNQRYRSTGPAVRTVTLKILDPDPKTGEGEIVAKGPNIMLGYYKEPELTKQTFTEDGWFRTGDLGVFDKDGHLYIRGRSKNMILGPSGENIYPEEIEAIINSFDNVNESLVVQREGKLVALVHVDFDEIEKKATEWFNEQKDKASDFSQNQWDKLKHSADIVNEYLKYLEKQLKSFVNQRVSKSARIHQVEFHSEPFVKTATKKIKRFLYSDKNTKN